MLAKTKAHYLPVMWPREFSDFPNGLNMSWGGLRCSLWNETEEALVDAGGTEGVEWFTDCYGTDSWLIPRLLVIVRRIFSFSSLGLQGHTIQKMSPYFETLFILIGNHCLYMQYRVYHKHTLHDCWNIRGEKSNVGYNIQHQERFIIDHFLGHSRISLELVAHIFYWHLISKNI